MTLFTISKIGGDSNLVDVVSPTLNNNNNMMLTAESSITFLEGQNLSAHARPRVVRRCQNK